jgi:hypothetical protein
MVARSQSSKTNGPLPTQPSLAAGRWSLDRPPSPTPPRVLDARRDQRAADSAFCGRAVFDNVGGTATVVERPLGSQDCLRGTRGERFGERARRREETVAKRDWTKTKNLVVGPWARDPRP